MITNFVDRQSYEKVLRNYSTFFKVKSLDTAFFLMTKPVAFTTTKSLELSTGFQTDEIQSC